MLILFAPKSSGLGLALPCSRSVGPQSAYPWPKWLCQHEHNSCDRPGSLVRISRGYVHRCCAEFREHNERMKHRPVNIGAVPRAARILSNEYRNARHIAKTTRQSLQSLEAAASPSLPIRRERMLSVPFGIWMERQPGKCGLREICRYRIRRAAKKLSYRYGIEPSLWSKS